MPPLFPAFHFSRKDELTCEVCNVFFPLSIHYSFAISVYKVYTGILLGSRNNQTRDLLGPTLRLGFVWCPEWQHRTRPCNPLQPMTPWKSQNRTQIRMSLIMNWKHRTMTNSSFQSGVARTSWFQRLVQRSLVCAHSQFFSHRFPRKSWLWSSTPFFLRNNSTVAHTVRTDDVLQVRPNYPRCHLVLGQEFGLARQEFGLALDIRNEVSKKALLSHIRFRGISVQAYEPFSWDLAVGVIHVVPEDFPNLDLETSVGSNVPVCAALRIGRTETEKLVFASETSQNHVTVGHTRFKVDSFVGKPLPCKTRRRFGHIDKAFQSPRRCGHCSEGHDPATCTAAQPRCANWKDHESSFHHSRVY